ncbi:MAG: 3-demethoxyubiquinol 3-hydroxylase [Saezia sanguinis]
MAHTETSPRSGSQQRPIEQPATLDDWLAAADVALKTVFAHPAAARPNPGDKFVDTHDMQLDEKQRRLSGALIRVDHVGEVCAQALYTAQSLTTKDPALRNHLKKAAQEEIDHLDWCRDRLNALGTHSSVLNPLWFAGAFAIGMAAGKLGGDKASLGFVIETENQVEAHLQGHLERLPANDAASRAVVEQMKTDEVEHAQAAERAGGIKLPLPIRLAMRAAAKVMTTTAHYI